MRFTRRVGGWGREGGVRRSISTTVFEKTKQAVLFFQNTVSILKKQDSLYLVVCLVFSNYSKFEETRHRLNGR